MTQSHILPLTAKDDEREALNLIMLQLAIRVTYAGASSELLAGDRIKEIFL